MAPQLYSFALARGANQRTVGEALFNETWIRDLRQAPLVQVIVEYFDLWHDIQMVPPLSNQQHGVCFFLLKNFQFIHLQS